MAQTLTINAGVGGSSDAQMRSFMSKVQAVMTTLLLNTAALAISAGGSALAKTVNVIKYMIGGNMYSKAAGNLAALSGTVTNAKFNVYCFFVDTAGTFTTAMGTEGATLADVVFPAYDPSTKCMIGFVIINPTGTGNFVGGTTPIDDATVVPNAVFVNTDRPMFDPKNFVTL